MIIDSSKFREQPGLQQATLTQSADAPATLSLVWAGDGPDWLDWMEPVTVMHRGRVLFHGRATSFARTHVGGSGMETTATVQDALWLLDHMSLGAQVAEIDADAQAQGLDFRVTGQSAMQSWTALAESCMVDAPGWIVTEEGEVREDAGAVLRLDVSRAHYSTGAMMRRDKVITAWTALLEMKNANPDAFYRFHPTTGTVEVVSIKEAPLEVWDTLGMGIVSAEGIGPQYESCITGVALVVWWTIAGGETSGSRVLVYPPGVDARDERVKVFTAQVESDLHAARQAEFMMGQIRAYYDACNELMWGGSVTALMQDVAESPLCRRLCLTGEGTHNTWHDMAAMVTAAEWDFLGGTVVATLGAQFDEPDISEMTFDDPSDTESYGPDDSSSSTTTESGGWLPGRPDSSSSTTCEWYWTNRPSTTEESTSTESDWWEGDSTTTAETTTDSGDGDSDTVSISISEEYDSTTELPGGTMDDSTDEGGCDCEGMWEAQKAFNALMHVQVFGSNLGDGKYVLRDRRCLPDWFSPDMSYQEVFDRVMERV